MSTATFYVLATPDDVRKSIPEFDMPMNAGPFLLIVFNETQVRVFNRSEAFQMLGMLLYGVDIVCAKMGAVNES